MKRLIHCRSQRGGGLQENTAHRINKAWLLGAHEAAIMKPAWVSARSSTYMLRLFSLGFLWDSQEWEWGCLWLFCLLLGPFCSYWVASFSHDISPCAWPYCILLYHIWFISLGSALFWRETEEEQIKERGGRREGRGYCGKEELYKRINF